MDILQQASIGIQLDYTWRPASFWINGHMSRGSWNHKLCLRTGLHLGSLECNQNSLKSKILIWTLMLWIESISWLKILWIDVPEVDKSELRISWSLPFQQGIDMDRHKLLLECGDGLMVMVLWWSRRAKYDPIENKPVLVGEGTGQVLQSGPHSFALHPPLFGFRPLQPSNLPLGLPPYSSPSYNCSF